MATVKKTICPLDCPDSCGLLATVENGRVVSLNGDPDHPYTRGVICRKMRAYPLRQNGAERLRQPMIRTGEKGEGKFALITWQEAWELLVARVRSTVQTHGPEAVMPFCYAGNMGLVNRFAGFPFFHRLNATRIEQTICSATASGGWKLGCGQLGGTPPEAAGEASLIVAWGINIRVSNLHFWQYVSRARRAGAKLLVIDPYRTDTARCADEYLSVKPGGDAALALGILRCLLVEGGRLDENFITGQTAGFDRLAAYLRATPLARFAENSGVPETDISRIASLFGAHTRTFIRIGVGLSRNSRGGMAVRGITSLAAALGLFDGQPGRGVMLFSGAFSGDLGPLCRPDLLTGQPRTVNMIHLGHALTALEPPIRLLFVYNANPLSVAPDGSMVRKGLARWDLFTVVHEQVMTPTARFADLLLPATTFLENRDLYRPYGHFFLGFGDRAADPAGESISNFELFQTLAQKMGYDDAPFSETVDDRIAAYLATVEELPESFSYEDLQRVGFVESTRARRFRSSVRQAQVRFSFVSPDTAPDMPVHACLVDAAENDNPDLGSRFGLVLITPPDTRLLNSTFGERYSGYTGAVLIHPGDAAARQVRDGMMVTIYNGRGRTVRRAVVTEDTRPGLLVAEGLFWPCEPESTGINDLVSQQCSDVGGGARFHEVRVEIAPA